MGFLNDLFSGPAKVMCTFTGGHDYQWRGRVLVCMFCGHVPGGRR